jgi:hypothetical protein
MSGWRILNKLGLLLFIVSVVIGASISIISNSIVPLKWLIYVIVWGCVYLFIDDIKN